MANIIDLSVFEDETLDIKLPDGRMVRIVKPVQRMVIEILKFKNLSEQSEPEKVIGALDKIVWNILYSNDAGIHYPFEFVQKELNTRMKLAIVQAYSNFIAGVQSDPN